MQTFSLDPRRWPVGLLFSRSPLVRRSDRLEVLAIAFALAISLLALPIVAAIATDVHQAHRGIYAEQAQTGIARRSRRRDQRLSHRRLVTRPGERAGG